jgi:hypothetical protein
MVQGRPIIGLSFQLLSNWCSMGCAGCGIRVAPPSGGGGLIVDRQHLANARTTLHLIKETLDSIGLEYAMVEQSGGEPTHHPEVIEAVGEVFQRPVHKIITNGLPVRSIYRYLKDRGDQAFVVVSIDHHKLELNRVRLGGMLSSHPDRAAETHNTVLENLDLLVTSDIPVVVSTIISKWNVAHYLDFIGWLEETYPRQIEEGRLVPAPVSLVSFGNGNLGKLNPSPEQVFAFEEAVHESQLLTLRRTREWLFKPLIGLYRNKERFFQRGESLEQIALDPSGTSCEIFRYMLSLDFQDEEIFRPPAEALFQGYSCGVKVLGNLGYPLDAYGHRSPLLQNRPSNMQGNKKYYRVDQIREYVDKWESVTHDREMIRMGDAVGYFSELRRGMCLLDDFDGVWWPFNMYLQGIVDDVALGEYWSLFKNQEFVAALRRARGGMKSLPEVPAASSDSQRA